MGQVRWAGWTMALATALLLSGGQAVRADVASDKPAAILVYPKVVVGAGIETVIRLTNTNSTTPINVHCFYLDANSHCSGGIEGNVCIDSGDCNDATRFGGVCIEGWVETDFDIVLTAGQPIQWEASQGLRSGNGLPLPFGVCERNPFFKCGNDKGCDPFPGGRCTQSNAGTAIPPVAEVPFQGELKCVAVNAKGEPIDRNELKGEGIIETSTPVNLDVASYNAIGIQAIAGAQTAPSNVLCLGGGVSDDCPNGAEYNGCPNVLILNHFFDDARDPVPGAATLISTRLTLVPCSEDLLRQIPGSAVVQYLVFNEFEQRFSTSNSVKCFSDTQLCMIGKGQCNRSIFNVGVAGTLTGQTRMSPIGTGALPSGLLGVAVETHGARSAAFNLHFQGERRDSDGNPLGDTVTMP